MTSKDILQTDCPQSPRAPFIGVSRHRIPTDGEGVTTLAAFSQCPLQCAYCLNPQCAAADGALLHLTPQELLDRVRVDHLYFLATGGGICFGGGEPSLRSDFIAEFHRLMPSEWSLYIETSLAVAPHHIETLVPLIDHWFIDVKDLHPDIYRRYTQHDIAPLMHNLLRLKELGLQDRCTLRLPLIPDYNDEALRAESQRQLEEMGFSQFDLFEYVVRQKPSQTLSQNSVGKAVAMAGLSLGISTALASTNINNDALTLQQDSISDQIEELVFGDIEEMGDMEEPEEEIVSALIGCIVEQYPEFPGGNFELGKFIKQHLHFTPQTDSSRQEVMYHVSGFENPFPDFKYILSPEDELDEAPITFKDDDKLRVRFSFIINSDGSVSDIKILQSAAEELSEETLRMVKQMPQWTPGKIGKNVKVRVVITLLFSKITLPGKFNFKL